MKQLLTITFLALAVLSWAQPANNDCGGAITLPISDATGNSLLPYCSGTTGVFTNVAATTSNMTGIAFPDPPPCFNLSGGVVPRDVWFKFTTPSTPNPIDISIEINTGSMVAPQMALYRGDCSGLVIQQAIGQPVACATSFTDISFNVIGLDASTEYFLRVSDFNAAGTFDICLSEFCSPVNMQNGSSNRCGCTFYDSGGPTGNYAANSNLIYTICPTTPPACLELNFQSYDIDCTIDGLFIYDGVGINAQNLLTVVRGTGTGLTVEAPSGCMTLNFISDGVIQGSGWVANWNCNAQACTPTATVDCNNPNVVSALPFAMNNLSTCGAGNNYDPTDACGSSYMIGEDYVFEYTSPGNECISIQLSNTSVATGLFVMNGCPNSDVTQCLAAVEASAGNPSVPSLRLDAPGTYYIVVSTEGCPICTDFNIAIDQAPCPMIVNPNVTASDLVETIAGNNAQITNVTLNCPPGAYGTFTGGPGLGTNIGGGIILSTGFANDAEGPNEQDGITVAGTDANTPIGSPGDALLSQLSGVTTVDACVLEFDVFAPSDLLSFRYIFASEEYLEWVGSQYNDVFAFTISGPGIIGQKLISYVPNTTIPITVSTVNNNNNNAYYINNPAGNIGTAYDGFTTVLTASTEVIPCETYHLRMAVGDGLDQFFDSGVLIEANSLFNNDIELEIAGVSVNGTPSAAENCLDGLITVTLAAAQSDTLIVDLDIQGTAINGIDYITIPAQLIFLPGQISATINIQPIADGIAELTENVTIYIYEICSDSIPSDSVTLLIQDDIDGAISLPDTAILCGAAFQMPLVGPNSFFYSWSPSEGLSDTTAPRPMVNPSSDITYTVIAGNGICFDTFDITVLVASLDLTQDTIICDPGSPVQLEAVTNLPATYTWTPATGLSASNISNPVATPQQTTEYIITINTPICQIIDTVTIGVFGDQTADVIPNTTICEGEAIQIGGDSINIVSYSWDPIDGLNDPTSSNPIAAPTTTTTYTVTTTGGNCQDQATVTITVGGAFTLNPINDQTIYQGDVLPLTATVVPDPNNNSPVGVVTYTWSPATGLSNSGIFNPTASPLSTTTYTVEVVSFANCSATNTFTITVLPPQYAFPNAFTPNGDAMNSYFRPIIEGNVVVEEFRVFNRWGQLVYNNGSTNGWDGTFGGENLPQDTYVYVARLRLPDGQIIDLKGDVLLIR